MRSEGQSLIRSLASSEGADLQAALRVMQSHRLFRKDFIPVVEELTDHPRPGTRSAACAGLAALGARGSTEALLERLEDESESVRRAAWTALRRLTGKQLPADPVAWRRHLERR